MKAINTTYATELNKAAERFGIEQAILQSCIDVAQDGLNLTGLKDVGAINYARQYARNLGVATVENNGGLYHAESNIMAAGWYLRQLGKLYGNGWLSIKAFFGMDPIGEAIMRRVYFTIYPKYKKSWG